MNAFSFLARFPRRSFTSLPTLSVALSVAACSGARSIPIGSTPDASPADDAPETASVCTRDDECASQLPATTPLGCAVAHCNAGRCTFTAKDEDQDGHPTAHCSALGSDTPIVTGDDCDDHNAELYPGHSLPCSTTEDGMTPNGALCAMGSISCLPDGMPSACLGTVACLEGESCAHGACSTLCTAEDKACSGDLQPETCVEGTWRLAGTPCVDSACVDGVCSGVCAPGAISCFNSGTLGQCDMSGTWQPATSCVHQACVNSMCQGECTPGATGHCNGNAPATCDDQGAWQSGVSCQGDTPACLAGTCVACNPGATTCIDDVTPSKCDASGAWQAETACVNTACVDGACSGACEPGAMSCIDEATVGTCDNQGNVQESGHCNEKTCVGGACVGVCSVGATRCSGRLRLEEQPETCNAAGQWEPSGPACMNQLCSPSGCGSIATVVSTGSVNGLASDGTSLYWTDTSGTVSELLVGIPIVSSPVLLASTPFSPDGIVVDGTDVYWTNGNQLLATPLDGGATTAMASSADVFDPTLHDGALYWLEWSTTLGSSILTMPVTGGSAKTLVSGLGNPEGLAVDATNVYWLEIDTNSVMKMPRAGGPLVTLAVGPLVSNAIATDGTSVYWLETDGSLMKVSIADGPTTTLVSGGQPVGSVGGSLTLSNQTVYWVAETLAAFTSTVSSVSIFGGTPVTVAAGVSGVGPIVLAGTGIFWVDNGNIEEAL